MPTGLSVLCFIRPDSRNLIIWFRSPEQNRHRQTEKSNKTTEPTILLTRSQYIWRDLCTSVIQYYSLGTCSYSDGEGEKGPDQHSWASEMVLNVPDPSVVYFFLSTALRYNLISPQFFYWCRVILITPLSSLSCWIPCLSTTRDAACPAI